MVSERLVVVADGDHPADRFRLLPGDWSHVGRQIPTIAWDGAASSPAFSLGCKSRDPALAGPGLYRAKTAKTAKTFCLASSTSTDIRGSFARRPGPMRASTMVRSGQRLRCAALRRGLERRSGAEYRGQLRTPRTRTSIGRRARSCRAVPAERRGGWGRRAHRVGRAATPG